MYKYSAFAHTCSGKLVVLLMLKAKTILQIKVHITMCAAGFSFRFEIKRSDTIKLQHINNATSDEDINGVFINFNQII